MPLGYETSSIVIPHITNKQAEWKQLAVNADDISAEVMVLPAQPYVQCPWVERLAALIDEDVGGLDPVRLLLPVQELETVHLIALQVVNTIGSTLEPADDDGAQRLLAGTRRSMHV
jgi:hypothetical protein